MPANIRTIVTELETAYAARFTPAVSFAWGEVERFKHKGLPIVIVVPTSGTIGIPQQRRPDPRAQPRALWRKDHTLEFVCCAKTEENADALHDNVLQLLFHEIGPDSLSMGSWRWITQDPDKAGLNVRSHEIVQQVTIMGIVTDEPRQLFTVIGTSHTGEWQDGETGCES